MRFKEICEYICNDIYFDASGKKKKNDVISEYSKDYAKIVRIIGSSFLIAQRSKNLDRNPITQSIPIGEVHINSAEKRESTLLCKYLAGIVLALFSGIVSFGISYFIVTPQGENSGFLLNLAIVCSLLVLLAFLYYWKCEQSKQI